MRNLCCLLLASLMLLMCACDNTEAQIQVTAPEKAETTSPQNTVSPTTQPTEITSINEDIYYGTWDIAAINVEGSTFTIDEVKAMGDDSFDGVRIVIKKGGKACFIDPQENMLIDWECTGEKIVFNGERDGEIIDDQLHFFAPDGELIFDKTSSEQIIAKRETEEETTAKSTESAGLRPEFKEAMDSYETFYDKYCAVLKEYKENPSDLTILAKYTDMMTQLTDMTEKFDAWSEEELNDEELSYYLEVNTRVMQKLLDVSK